MKRSKEIFKQLGFNSQSPVTTQEAFLRHLERAKQLPKKYLSENVRPTPSVVFKKQEAHIESEQLSFDPDLLKPAA